MTFAGTLLALASLPVVGATGYLASLTLLSRQSAPPEPPDYSSLPRFDLIVPAHNEALNIAATVASLLAVDYPADLRRVVVVADNCTDDTAERARAAGATVLVRNDTSLRGKGHALAHAFDHTLASGSADAVVVVDADTLVSPNLLRAFAARLARGAQAVQADYTVRNPDASWRTRLMTIALATFHGVRSLGRERLGLSCGLRGNGMCFTAELLRQVPHQAFSLVEDVEYGIRLGEAGHRIHYAHEAHVFGEMPSDEGSSRTQRRRWEEGRAALAREQGTRLLGLGLRRRDPVLVDLALDLLVPPLATVALAAAAGAAASLALSWRAQMLLAASWPWLGSLAAIAAYVLRGWSLSGTGLAGLASLAASPAYVAWKLMLKVRSRARTPRAWVRTARAGEAPRDDVDPTEPAVASGGSS